MFILMTVMVLVGTFVGVKLMGLTTLPAVEKHMITSCELAMKSSATSSSFVIS